MLGVVGAVRDLAGKLKNIAREAAEILARPCGLPGAVKRRGRRRVAANRVGEPQSRFLRVRAAGEGIEIAAESLARAGIERALPRGIIGIGSRRCRGRRRGRRGLRCLCRGLDLRRWRRRRGLRGGRRGR